MQSRLLPLAVLLLLQGCGSNSSTTSERPSLEGIVQDSLSGSRLADVLIQLRSSGFSLSTDENGHFAFYRLEAGPETLVIDQPPWERYEAALQIAGPLTLSHDPVLERDRNLPWLEFDTDTLDFSWHYGERWLRIRQGSEVQAPWTLDDPPSWLEVERQEGSTPDSLWIRVDRSGLASPSTVVEQLVFRTTTGAQFLPAAVERTAYPDLEIVNQLLRPVQIEISGTERALLPASSSILLPMDHDFYRLGWELQRATWEGRLLGIPFAWESAETQLVGGSSFYIVNQRSDTGGDRYQLFLPRIVNTYDRDLWLAVNYNTEREDLGPTRIPVGSQFNTGYFDAGEAADPINVVLFESEDYTGTFWWVGTVPAGRDLDSTLVDEQNIREFIDVGSGLMIVPCCSGTEQEPALSFPRPSRAVLP